MFASPGCRAARRRDLARREATCVVHLAESARGISIVLEEITEARRKAIVGSIRTISVEELKALGERLFPHLDHPWRERFFAFLTDNPGATFHHATTHDRVQIVYCHAKDKGMWFMPGIGMGPMQPKGLGIFKQIVEGR